VRSIKKVVKQLLGEDSKVFLFGSVLKKSYTACSDIDVLIFSSKIPESGLKRAKIIAEIRKRSKLWRPFEIHLVNERMFNFYKKMVDRMEEV
jgi:hypothetical protein